MVVNIDFMMRSVWKTAEFFLNLFMPPHRPGTWIYYREITKIFSGFFPDFYVEGYMEKWQFWNRKSHQIF